MVEKWLAEIQDIVKKGEEKVSGVRRAREQRLAKRTKIGGSIRKKIVSILKEVQPIVARYQKGNEGKTNLPSINVSDDGSEVVFEMPKLSDVNTLDLCFHIEINADCTTAKLSAYRKTREKRELIGSTAENYDAFVKDITKRFLQAWYSRKLSDELDKEREYKIAITAKGLR